MARRETNAPTLRTHRRDLRAFLAVVAVGMGTGTLHVDGARTGLRGHAGQRLSARRPHASSLSSSSSCRHDVTFAITPLVFVRVTGSVDSARNLGSWHPRLRISPCLPPNCFSCRLAWASHAGCVLNASPVSRVLRWVRPDWCCRNCSRAPTRTPHEPSQPT